VEHWGSFFGEIGSANQDTLTAPTAMTLPGTVARVATSNSTEYALLTNGSVYAWGQGHSGELGNGSTLNSFTAPVRVQFPAGVVIASLPVDAMPYDTGLAVDTSGNAWGWGFDHAGQLCQGTTRQYDLPVEIPLPGVTSLAGAGDHAVYDSNGTVYACGANNQGDLGSGSSTLSSVPVATVGLPHEGVKQLVASYENSGALMSDGTYFDWGLNAGGQLGDGTRSASSTPVQVNLPLPVTMVAQGGSIGTNGQTLVMLSDGSLRAWGNDQDGQLGDGGTRAEALPIEIFPPPGVTYGMLASGGVTSYGVSTGGEVYAWGANGHGQVGIGTTQTPVLSPVAVLSGASHISATAQNVATAG
jgi:alpha-tubulin suppressor-like RCC1 family protein